MQLKLFKIKFSISKIRNEENLKINLINGYKKNGRQPWSIGYNEYKEDYINKELQKYKKNQGQSFEIEENFGLGLDERCVEYPWIFYNLPKNKCKMLDAGSTFNFDFIVNHELIKNKDLDIITYYPESNKFNEKRISYIYNDLREISIKDSYYDCIVSQSTIEHIEMDNSIYGYSSENEQKNKSFEFLKAISEMIRTLKKNGTLLLTFPYGKFENHGFFQQFDHEMLEKLLTKLNIHGLSELTFMKYTSNGWEICSQQDCNEMVSFNPHTGLGKGNDGAAHCRGICCIKFYKKK